MSFCLCVCVCVHIYTRNWPHITLGVIKPNRHFWSITNLLHAVKCREPRNHPKPVRLQRNLSVYVVVKQPASDVRPEDNCCARDSVLSVTDELFALQTFKNVTVCKSVCVCVWVCLCVSVCVHISFDHHCRQLQWNVSLVSYLCVSLQLSVYVKLKQTHKNKSGSIVHQHLIHKSWNHKSFLKISNCTKQRHIQWVFNACQQQHSHINVKYLLLCH